MQEEDSRKVFVSNIADELTEDLLKQFLGCLGKIVSIQRIVGSSQRVYSVVYSTSDEAKTSTEAAGTVLIGRPIQIVQAGAQPPKDASPQPHGISTSGALQSGDLGASPPPGTLLVPTGTPPPTSKNFKENPYVKPPAHLAHVPYTPMVSTGNDEKDQEIARTIHLSNINSKVSPAELVDFFSPCGPIAYIRMAGDEQQPTRFAFIEFLEIDSAHKAMLLTGKILMDRAVKVNRSKNTCQKPVVQLTRDEEKRFDYALYMIGKKLHQHEKRRRRESGESAQNDQQQQQQEESGGEPRSSRQYDSDSDEDRRRFGKKRRRTPPPHYGRYSNRYPPRDYPPDYPARQPHFDRHSSPQQQ